MRRLSLSVAAVAALVPATLGLLGNSSFAESVPARVPAAAQVVGADGPRRPRPRDGSGHRHADTDADGRVRRRPRW